MHHDGPFDAVTKHRNRQDSQRAPMLAFPEGSLNNSLGGAGPLNPRANHSTFMGDNDDDAFRDYSTSAVAKSYRNSPDDAVFDPKSKGEIIHGDETIGLGTSTFLAGTPAARTAIQKAEQERIEDMADGLQRKKSLAQRIRGINRGGGGSGRYDRTAAYRNTDLASAPISEEDHNPFDEYRAGDDHIDLAKKPMSSPQIEEVGAVPRRLERRATTESMEGGSGSGGGSGGTFISRMKSLKGSNRRRPSDAQGPHE